MSRFDHRRSIVVTFAVVAVLLLARASGAATACDVDGSAAASLAEAREAIDAACPCASATSPGPYRKCAKAVVNARVEEGSLEKPCKRAAFSHAKLSICGRPGAVVCCRVKSNGRTSHKVAREAAQCTASPNRTACVSSLQSVPTGCNATGCVPEPDCGNGVVESGEECDPPESGVCSSTCQTLVCDPPLTDCGDGTLQPGEDCDPPGVGSCGRDCQTAPCAAAGAGEVAVACVEGATSVGAASDGTGYMLGWTGPFQRDDDDVIARRFDADAAPIDATATVVSQGATCDSWHYGPSIAGNGNGYFVVWGGSGPVEDSGRFFNAIYARTIDDGGSLGGLDELVWAVPFGMCQAYAGPPTAASPAPPTMGHGYIALWLTQYYCFGSFMLSDPDGVLVDYGGGPPAYTSLDVGYTVSPPPTVVAVTSATSALLGNDALVVWHAALVPESGPATPRVAGSWVASDGDTTHFWLGSRRLNIADRRPSVAAAADRFLVAWAQAANDMATDATEIRGMRATRADGPIDVDGGILLATSGGAIRGGPVVAFDGTVWVVAWTEAGIGGNDLRLVAVQPDGTVVDATPRLIASGLADGDPAIASVGDGRALVIYVRPDAGSSAVRAKLVPGM